MPLSLPNLDDRRYDDLVREALTMIPALAPEWTNHNASDPGITLVELLAYLAEILIYRVNQVGDRHLAVFILLLTGKPARDNQPLMDQLRRAVLDIRSITRAVTADDYSQLALQVGRDPGEPGVQQVVRAHCLPGVNLAIRGEHRNRPDQVTVIVVPKGEGDDRHPKPSGETLARVRKGLEEYRLITTHVHVVGPQYVPVRISGTVTLVADAEQHQVRRNINSAVTHFLQAVGGPKGGWPFGKDIYASELYDLIERLPGVDYVNDLELETSETSRIERGTGGAAVRIDLRENELPMAEVELRTRFPMGGPGKFEEE